ncbi:MAG: hypothetical protein A3G97_01625 [Candidatus Rokubacteria bacterium RIFCSPLOWO2_12_FULL_69_21]|nr:MAG: hypothetical protein A3G97_01625 [Candidatus Rokubacteria bacterium RIFCSPLOWO2_12_FULL_69_21]
MILAMVALGAAGGLEAQEGLTKQDRQGPVTVAVTLTAAPAVGAPIKVKVVLDTHSVGLDGIAFDKVVALRSPDGADIAPTAVEQATGSGHHREATLIFPPPAQAGPLKIVVKNVGGVAERSFVWELGPAR